MTRYFVRGIGLAAIMFCACEDEQAQDGYLDLVVRSDLDAQELRYVRVELLGARGADVLQESWFTLDAGCVAQSEGERGLFSLSLARDKSATARLRVTGYGYDDSGALQALISQRFDTEVPGARSTLLVDLRAVCTLDKVSCAPTQSCAPDTGRCEDVALNKVYLGARAKPAVLDCAQAISAAPGDMQRERDAQVAELDAGEDAGLDATPDAMDEDTASPQPVCTTGDGVCGAGCSPVEDRDCRRAAGEVCEQNENCSTDLLCVHGVCCTSSCTDSCARCDLPGSQGLCTPIDYTRSEDKQHCGGCGLACGGSHVSSASCAQGSCQYECDTGYRDCDGERSGINGCEQDVRSDARNCGSCGRDCASVTGFPYCQRGTCAEAIGTGWLETDYPVPAGSVIGTPLHVNNGATVLALAALVAPDDQLSPGELVLGLAERNSIGMPSRVVTQTSTLVPRDGATAVNGKLVWTQGQVSAAQITPGDYWLLITATKPLRIMSHPTPKAVYREDQVGLTYFSSGDFYGELNTSLTLSLSAVVVEN